MQRGPSCRCVNCKNIPTYITQQDTEQELQDEIHEYIQQQDGLTDSKGFDADNATSDEDERMEELELNRDVDCIMEEVFGVPF